MRKLAFAAAMLLAGGASASAAQLTLTSSDIKPGARIADEQVANGFGCSGGNVSPALSWSGAPKGTKSFAISVYDPDAPTGSGFWHWAMFDIPANVDVAAQERRRSQGDPRPSRRDPGKQ